MGALAGIVIGSSGAVVIFINQHRSVSAAIFKTCG